MISPSDVTKTYYDILIVDESHRLHQYKNISYMGAFKTSCERIGLTTEADELDWKQFHNPKDLAISISLEASELLEVFQWSGEDVGKEGKIEKIKEELADVMNYCVLMADACGLNIDNIIQEKIKLNNEKYPVEKAKGRSEKYNSL